MKKLLTKFTAICLALTIGAFCVGCGNKKYSETFKGAVSTETYDSVENAVKGFLELEVSGKATNAVFVGYKKDSSLSKGQIKKLELGEYSDGLVSAEKGTVEYTESLSEESKLLAKPNSVKAKAYAEGEATLKRTVYILTYTDLFRFFVPQMTTGESLTASYYDSTFKAEKYFNCTMNATMENRYSNENRESTVVAKVTEEALYEYDEYTSSNESGTYTSYGMDVGGKLNWVQKQNDGDFKKLPYSENYAIKEFFTKWFDSRFGELDHTFFEKTETGYALRSDKYNAYLKASGMESLSGSDYELKYVINIKDGRMADVTMLISTEDFMSSMTIEFSDFGTTKIDMPDEVTNLFNA